MISRKGEKVWSPNFGIRLQESRVSESTNWVCLTRGGFGFRIHLELELGNTSSIMKMTEWQTMSELVVELENIWNRKNEFDTD